jgi:hypothetical protein
MLSLQFLMQILQRWHRRLLRGLSGDMLNEPFFNFGIIEVFRQWP